MQRPCNLTQNTRGQTHPISNATPCPIHCRTSVQSCTHTHVSARIHTVPQAFALIGDQLVAYDAAADEAEARAMCERLIALMAASGLCEKRVDEEEERRIAENMKVKCVCALFLRAHGSSVSGTVPCSDHFNGPSTPLFCFPSRRDKFSVGRTIVAFHVGEDMWHDAEIRAVLPDDRFTVFFTDFALETELGLRYRLSPPQRTAAIMNMSHWASEKSTRDIVFSSPRI
jgi:hypothetical protein